MHRQRNIYQSRTLDLLRNCLSDGQDGGCKQLGQTVTIWLKALLMPRLAVCSCDLHWHWINWPLLCDTMWMLCLAWLPIAQHVFQPALTGRIELISRKIDSSEQEQRLSWWADFAKNCLPRIECKELPRFRKKYRALGRHVCKIHEIGGQKNGVQHATVIYPIRRYTRLRYIGLTLHWSRWPRVFRRLTPLLLQLKVSVSYHIPFWVTHSGGTVGCQNDSLPYHQRQSTVVVLTFNFQSFYWTREFDLWNYGAVTELCIVNGIMTLFSTWIHALRIKQNKTKKVFLWK